MNKLRQRSNLGHSITKKPVAKTGSQRGQTGIALLAALVTSALLAQTAHAQFSLPPGQGSPKGTAGGGSRPAQPYCLQKPTSQETLVALAPTRFVGSTFHASPAVWVYVPNTIAKTLEFSLFTEEREGVYQTTMPINASGLLKITVPATVTLAPGKPYYWTAALVCQAKRRTNDWIVGGWIQQQPLPADLQRQLSQTTAEQQVQLYTESGFWYEALNIYLKLQQTRPGDANLTTMWTNLLQSAELPPPIPSKQLLPIAPSPGAPSPGMTQTSR